MVCASANCIINAIAQFFRDPSRGFSVIHPLLDVVDQAEQFPLAIDFPLATQCEAIKPLVVADIAEDRFDGRESLSVQRATLFAVDALAHPLCVSGDVLAGQDRDLARDGGAGFAQALFAQLAIGTGRCRCAEFDRGVVADVALGAIAIELFPGGASRVRLISSHCEPIRSEHAGRLSMGRLVVQRAGLGTVFILSGETFVAPSAVIKAEVLRCAAQG